MPEDKFQLSVCIKTRVCSFEKNFLVTHVCLMNNDDM